MFKRISDPAIVLDAPVRNDESVCIYQCSSYDARQPNQSEGFEIQVQKTCIYFWLSEAFIEVEREIVTNVVANTPYGADIRVGFVNNGTMV